MTVYGESDNDLGTAHTNWLGTALFEWLAVWVLSGLTLCVDVCTVSLLVNTLLELL